jgi:hypothetical protein
MGATLLSIRTRPALDLCLLALIRAAPPWIRATQLAAAVQDPPRGTPPPSGDTERERERALEGGERKERGHRDGGRRASSRRSWRGHREREVRGERERV